MALRIKSLLYDQGYTIPGARQVFKTEAKLRETAVPDALSAASSTNAVAEPVAAPQTTITTPENDPAVIVRRTAQLQALRRELNAMLTLLQNPVAGSGRSGTATHSSTPRPRLVLEPRPEPKPAPARLETLRLVSSEREPRSRASVSLVE